MIATIAELKAKLNKLAIQQCANENEDLSWNEEWCAIDLNGGHADDTYQRGCEDGSTQLAREVLADLERLKL